MQSGRSAAEATKEKAADLAASARSGMEKTKATLEEKAERMTTRDPLQKELATEKKYDKQDQAELEKQRAYDEHHAATRQAAEATRHTTHVTTGPGGTTGYTAHMTGGTAPGYGAGYTDYSTGTGTGTGTAPGYAAGQYTTAGTVPGYAGHHVTSGTGATTGYGAGLTGHGTTGADEVPDPNYPIGTEPGDRRTAAPRQPPGPDYNSTGRRTY